MALWGGDDSGVKATFLFSYMVGFSRSFYLGIGVDSYRATFYVPL